MLLLILSKTKTSQDKFPRGLVIWRRRRDHACRGASFAPGDLVHFVHFGRPSARSVPRKLLFGARASHEFESLLRFSAKQNSIPSGMLFHFGGEGEIRTLETLLGFTRFPVVRPRPG